MFLTINSQDEYNLFVADIAKAVSEMLKSKEPQQLTFSKRKAMVELHLGLPRLNELIAKGELKCDPFGQIIITSIENYKRKITA